MKKTIVRILALVLMLATVAAFFASCGGSGTGGSETKKETQTKKPGAETTAEEKSNFDQFLEANPGLSFQDKTFNILVYPDDDTMIWGDVDWCASEMTGDTLNDAVFEKNGQVQDALGIDIVATPMSDHNNIKPVQASIQAGDQLYNAMNMSMNNAFSMAQNSYLKELHTYEDLDLTASWWDQNIIKDMSIAHKNYVLTGDIGTMYKKSISVIMFNKVIFEQIDDSSVVVPYESMAKKEWTIEEMTKLGALVSNDENGDDKMDENDKYGLIYFCNIASAAMLGAGTNFVTKNDEDIPELSFYSESTVEILETLADLLYDSNTSYSWSKTGKGEETAFTMYKADQALFYYGELHSVATMRSMASDFGILPMPLFDEFQDSYHHTINPDVAATIVIPNDDQDGTFTAKVLDALGASSKDILTVAYYDVNLQGKVSRDEESAATLDIVISTINYDVGYLAITNLQSMMKGLVDGHSTNLTSVYATNETTIKTALEKIVSKFTED